VPGNPEENYWFRRHEAAYEWLLPHVRGQRVLEVGCGEGYGTALLATAAASIVGVDYDALTVAHAARAYLEARFVRGNLAALPFESAKFDVLVTLQVIEHVWNHREFVAECRRVLRPGGKLVVTTPNRLTFSPGSDVPLNPFHTKEFTAAELRALIERGGFHVSDELGLHAGPQLVQHDDTHGGFVAAQIAATPDAWSARLRADVAGVTTADFVIAAADERDIDDCLDLILVAAAPST
jgi:SAM-dependent methyltransferase